MNTKNDLLIITNEIYRITLLFPKKEPLRYKIRELANDILANFISLNGDGLDQFDLNLVKSFNNSLEITDNFLEVAKNQNWVRAEEILSLQQGYSKIKEIIKNLPEKKEEEFSLQTSVTAEKKEPSLESDKPDIPERQKKILEILKKKNQAQIWEIKEAFPDVSKRTLRRDFKKMVQDNMVERIGEKNSTFYRVKART
jgi:hypothetical protein